MLRATVIAIVASAGGILAQDLTGLPECAKPCFTDNLSHSICKPPPETKCLCTDNGYYKLVESCVIKACTLPEDIATREWYKKKCAGT